MSDRPDLKKIWGNLRWNDETTAQLYQKIKRVMKSGVDINLMSKRLLTAKNGVPKVEEYTLYDLAIDARLTSQKQNAAHWFALMNMLRKLGARSACQLVRAMTPIEKEKNKLDSIKILQDYLEEREFFTERKICYLSPPFGQHQRN